MHQLFHATIYNTSINLFNSHLLTLISKYTLKGVINLIEKESDQAHFEIMDKDIDVYGIIYSTFGELGPKPEIWIPNSITYDMSLEILMRSTCFISVDLEKMHNKLSMFPFPEYNIIGITYYYEEPTDTSETWVTASITILLHEDSQQFFNRNIGNIKTNLQSLIQQLNNNKNRRTEFLTQYYNDLIELINSYKSLEIIAEPSDEIGEKDKNAVLLTYFNSKMGPVPFYIYPENIIDEKKQYQISQELNIEITKGFYTRSYPGFVALHHYFDLPSVLARGKTEMCLLTFILEKMPSQETISQISFHFTGLINKLRNKPNVAWGFYTEGYIMADKMDLIQEMNEFIKEWIEEVYEIIVERKTN